MVNEYTFIYIRLYMYDICDNNFFRNACFLKNKFITMMYS